MTDYPIDIILPVWNRPVDVRASLASFVSDSPMARIIMINNGSERETESILNEFADALDDRALLVASARNIGSVAAVNLGISRSGSQLLLVATPYTRLSAGWFDSVPGYFDKYPELGTLVLSKCQKSDISDLKEADCGSFDAMVIRKSLYDDIGGFDESMDGSFWTLRDFARRTLLSGYITCQLPCSSLKLIDYRELGSDVRRKERTLAAQDTYISRWGRPRTFLFYCSTSIFGSDLEAFRQSLLKQARYGDRIVVTAERGVAKELQSCGLSNIHVNISFHALPRFFSLRALSKITDTVLATDQSAFFISDTLDFNFNMESLSFNEFIDITDNHQEQFYNRK